jgi:ribosome-associated protein
MDIRKLQRAIVDGLEDVKAQHIVVFNTEHLSPLFERVIVASGNTNRQTKALASSVRVAVKAAGLQVLRTEGEDNGEWIIVDCGAAVAHIMQPSIRDYYRLEEIWGGKPVKMKLGDDKVSLVKASEEMEPEPVAKKSRAKKATPERATTATSRAGKAALAGAKPAKAKPARQPVDEDTVPTPKKKPTAARKVTTGGAGAAKAAAGPAARAPARAPARASSAKPASPTGRAPAKSAAAPVARKSGAKPPVKTTAGSKTPARKVAAKAAPIKTIVVKPTAPRGAKASAGAKKAPARKTSR